MIGPLNRFENTVVKKPWGEEYLLYHNKDVELWHLRINPGQRTSFHAHPEKKTGLVVLDGTATIRFFGNQFDLKPLDKVMIRPGLFHSTHTGEGVTLLEIETPPDKDDLVRLEDPYGRAGQPYESSDAYRPALGRVVLDYSQPCLLNNCNLRLLDVSGPFEADDSDLLMVLAGGLYDPKTGKRVLSPGDVINYRTYTALINAFTANALSIVSVTRTG